LRAIVAGAIAYALALQMVLLGVIATQMAVAPAVGGFEICLGDPGNADSQHQPDGTAHPAHLTCVVCAFATAAGLPAAGGWLQAPRLADAVTPQHAPAAPLHLGRRRSPLVPQGPPRLA
jgi:hypothetical protein